MVVTRYFGGVKLGASGLVRAYSGCAAENLDAAQKVLYETCSELKVTVDYPLIDAALRFFGEVNAGVINTGYLNEVIFTVVIKRAEKDGFVSTLKNRLCGKVKIEKSREYFFPFKI